MTYIVVKEKRLAHGGGSDERVSRNYTSRQTAEEFMALMLRNDPTLVLRIKAVGK